MGEVLKIRATDYFEVVGDTVTIRDAGNAVLEAGATVLAEGSWHYTATKAIAVDVAVTIEAIATDHPGHTGSHSVQLAVA